jgi:precorrin-6B methylase 2
VRNLKAEMFNRKASDPKNKPDKILEALTLQQGQKVADIGAGGGYFSIRFAEAVGRDGRVFAVDTNPKFHICHLLSETIANALVKFKCGSLTGCIILLSVSLPTSYVLQILV